MPTTPDPDCTCAHYPVPHNPAWHAGPIPKD